MNKENFIKTLNNPSLIQQENTSELKSVIEEFPYFQSARALYLKALKNQDSFKYNNELKVTAAYTTDRTILFDFITSEVFNTTSKVIVEKTEPIPEITSEEKETYIEVIPEEYSQEIIEVKKDLELGKPLSFSKAESHSFNQWLQLSVQKTVVRETVSEESQEKPKEKSTSQENIIDQFIANNPKISKVSKTSTVSAKVKEINEPNELMTETLARVYLEQKKYGNAIQAYKILSLKYPEKSGFFADQIKRVQILQNNI